MTNSLSHIIINRLSEREQIACVGMYVVHIYGGIAQLARVLGSYPIGRRFESHCRYYTWPVGQEVKTLPFHGGIMGSIPVRVTKSQLTNACIVFVSYFFAFLEYPDKI